MKPAKWYIDNKVWPTMGNQEILISEMTTAHLKNSYLRCVTNKWRLKMVPLLLEELAHRGFKETHPEYFV